MLALWCWRGTVQPSAQNKPSEGAMANYGNTNKVMSVLLEHTDQPVTLDVIMKKTGMSVRQVQQTLYNLRTKKGTDTLNLEVIVEGQLWKLHSAPVAPAKNGATVSGKRMFEEIGPAKDGSIIIQDDEGKLYRAVEL